MFNPVIFIVAFPLAGALLNITLGSRLPKRAVEAIAATAVACSFGFAVNAFLMMDGPSTVRVFDWISFAGFSAPIELHFDALSGPMAVMVSGVSAIIHVYSIGYMRHDEGHARFFGLLNLFVFSMLVLVLASNLPLLYLGWEGVGFCSYALIGFWYADTKNADAGRKAFVVTRVGDVSLGIALIWLYYLCGTTGISGINATAGTLPHTTATLIGLLLLFGAAGKSAQLPLSTWLPDAMAGPTPVSALIHAATMVTAGVYLLMRLFPVMAASEIALGATAVVGTVTAFYAASAALVQRDIKKVLAYSTMSQIGYMFLAVGAGAVSGALFHLFTHAFFKALLFMGAGCIIHALQDEQDMFRMGGLMYRMPVVFWCFLAGALALCAAPGTAGFFSKDEILTAVLLSGGPLYTALWAVGELTALITTVYVFRAVFTVFLGDVRTEPAKVSGLMLATLAPLALMSIAGGVLNVPDMLGGSMMLANHLASQGISPLPAEHTAWGLAAFAAIMPIAGIAATYYVYVTRPGMAKSLADRNPGLVEFLKSGWGLDALYTRLFVRPYTVVATFLWKRVDEGVVDAAAVGAAYGIAGLGTRMRLLSVTGRASTYIMAVVAGAAALLAYVAWR